MYKREGLGGWEGVGVGWRWGGWEGGGVGWVEGVGGKPEAGYTVQLDCLE